MDLYGVSAQVNAASAALAGGIAAAGLISDPQQQALATGTAYATYFMSVKDLVPAFMTEVKITTSLDGSLIRRIT